VEWYYPHINYNFKIYNTSLKAQYSLLNPIIAQTQLELAPYRQFLKSKRNITITPPTGTLPSQTIITNQQSTPLHRPHSLKHAHLVTRSTAAGLLPAPLDPTSTSTQQQQQQQQQHKAPWVWTLSARIPIKSFCMMTHLTPTYRKSAPHTLAVLTRVKSACPPFQKLLYLALTWCM